VDNAASIVLDDLVTGLQSIADLNSKVFSVLTEEELVHLSAAVPTPMVGVLYGGLVGARTEKPFAGASKGHMLVSLCLVFKVDGVLGPEVGAIYRNKAVVLLDQMRKYMFTNPSQLVRPWQFLSERSPVQKGLLTVWVQTWAVDCILT
jgi:hypothetical protein